MPYRLAFRLVGAHQVSTNTGIAVQNYVTAESAYVLVAPAGEAASVEELKPKYILDKVSSFELSWGEHALCASHVFSASCAWVRATCIRRRLQGLSEIEMRQVFDIRGRYGTFGKIDTIDVKKTKVATGLPHSLPPPLPA